MFGINFHFKRKALDTFFFVAIIQFIREESRTISGFSRVMRSFAFLCTYISLSIKPSAYKTLKSFFCFWLTSYLFHSWRRSIGQTSLLLVCHKYSRKSSLEMKELPLYYICCCLPSKPGISSVSRGIKAAFDTF